MNFDKFTGYFMSVAMGSLKYADILKLDAKKVSDTLGVLLAKCKSKFKNISPQELVLLVVYLTDVKEEFFDEYTDIYCNILGKIISTSKDIGEQMNKMLMVENMYYDFDLNKSFNFDILF